MISSFPRKKSSNAPTVVIGVDTKYLPGAIACLRSIGRFTPGTRVVVLVNDVSREHQQLLKTVGRESSLRLEIRTPNFNVNSLQHNGHYSPAMHLRLLIPDVCPDAKRVVYLDSDTIALESIQPLLDMDLKGHAVAAVEDTGIPTFKDRNKLDTFTTDPKELNLPYLNSGVLVVDVDKWRELQITEKCLQSLSTHKFGMPDQDALNSVLKGNWLQIDKRWNTPTATEFATQKQFKTKLSKLKVDVFERELDAKILHYLGPIKPWNEEFPHGRNLLRFQEFAMPISASDQSFPPSTSDNFAARLTNLSFPESKQMSSTNPKSDTAVVLGVDSKYIAGALACMKSISKFAPGTRVIVLVHDVSAEEKQFLKTFGLRNSLDVEIRSPQYDVSRLPKKFHFSPAMHLRLFISEVCPDIKRAIYMDSDTIALQELQPLFTMDMQGKAVAGVADFGAQTFKERHKISPFVPYIQDKSLANVPYLNSGVLVIDVDKWRELSITEKCVAFLGEHPEMATLPDQDALNAVLKGNWLPIDSRWNTPTITEFANQKTFKKPMKVSDELFEREMNPRILHFLGPVKPWHENYPIGRNLIAFKKFTQPLTTQGVVDTLAAMDLSIDGPLGEVRASGSPGSHIVYRVKSQDGKNFIARVSTDGLSRARLENGHRVSRMLAGSTTVGPVHENPIPAGDKLLSVLPFGEPVKSNQLDPVAIGALLRRFHDHAQKQPSEKFLQVDPMNRLRNVQLSIKNFTDNKSEHKELVTKFDQAIKQAERESEPSRFNVNWHGLAHGDIWPGNFITADGQLRLIDTDFSGKGSVLGDFAQFEFAKHAFGWSDQWIANLYKGYGRKPEPSVIQPIVRIDGLTWIGYDLVSGIINSDPGILARVRTDLEIWVNNREWVTNKREIPETDTLWSPPLLQSAPELSLSMSSSE